MKIESESSHIVSALLVLPMGFSGALALMSISAAIGLPIDLITDWTSRLPEKVAEDAKKILEDHPGSKYGKKVQALFQEAYAKDDGSEQRIKMEKFKILADKEKSLADLPNQAEKLKTEIAALEKELGLDS